MVIVGPSTTNYNIRKNLPYFRFNTHDAEGGVVTHFSGTPIFPEEWSMIKLARMVVD